MVNAVSSASPVSHAYLNPVQHQPPAKPAHSRPTETTPQDDKVQLTSAAKKASRADVDHDGDSR